MPSLLVAQYNHQFILEDLNGDELIEKLEENFTPINILNYSHSRDTLFKRVYSINDSLSGIYSGMTLYLDPTKDPTSAVYTTGKDNDINTEHCYPRSKGAEFGNAKSDMHHLFPSRLAVNSDRGNLPFGEISDNSTKKWYLRKSEMSQKPNANIDLYSEWITDRFEPRESVKGNIARAMFYFFTIYQEQAMNADPNFFETQREVLCQWHELDPIDSTEWARSMKISEYQENKANPFVLDCSLAQRSYCPEIIDICYPLNVKFVALESDVVLGDNKPNPFSSTTIIPVQFMKPGNMSLVLLDLMGNEVCSIFKGKVEKGNREFIIDNEITSGYYIYKLSFIHLNQKLEIHSKKLIKF